MMRINKKKINTPHRHRQTSDHFIKKLWSDKEAMFLKECVHPNIVQYLGNMEVDGEKYMIIEYSPNGDLYDWVNNHQCELLREDQIVFVSRYVSSCLCVFILI